MSEPNRWSSSEGGAPEGVSELLRHARRARPMTGVERARSAARIDRIAALPAAAGWLLWAKGAALAAGLAVAAVGASQLPGLFSTSGGEGSPAGGAAAPTTALSAVPPADVLPSPSLAAPAPIGEVVPAPSAPASAAPLAPSPKASAPQPTGIAEAAPADGAQAPLPEPEPAAPVDTLARETQLLEEARSALASRPSEALSRLETHAAEFPAGKLGMERELLAVDALRRLGRLAEARARAEGLLARSRGGLYEERVRRMLEALP